jgi:hemolysin D
MSRPAAFVTAVSVSDANAGPLPAMVEPAPPPPLEPPVIESRRGSAHGDREFLPAALELLVTPPSPISTALLWLICLGFTATIAWGYFGKLDIHAVAQGRIQPSGRSKVVQPLEPGRVVVLNVENGTHVDAGAVLLELDHTETAADRDALRVDLEAAMAEAARRQAAVAAAGLEPPKAPPIAFPDTTPDGVGNREKAVLATDVGQLAASRASLRAQLGEHEAMRRRLQVSIGAREKLLALAKERADMREQLNSQGSLSRALIIDSLQQQEQMQAQLIAEQGQLAETEAQMVTLQRKMEETTAQFVAEQNQKLAEAGKKRDRLEQELVKAVSKNDHTRLASPIAGTVQQLAVTTIGQVVAPGQPLMTIVPDDGPIEVEAYIQNGDIGFVRVGQPVAVKIDAFPFTRFGTISGMVVKVSREAVEEREANSLSDSASAARTNSGGVGAAQVPRMPTLVFPAIVSLSRTAMLVDDSEVPLSPGMTVTVEIRTGDRRAIDYVLSPLREMQSRAAHER